MEFITGFGSTLIGYVVPFLCVLTIVVFFHELGHFLVGRWCGVKVNVFSIGFGPELFGRNDRHGTRWRVAAIPLGGYVKFEGDESAASNPDTEALSRMTPEQRSVSFPGKSVGQRAAIVAAGPIANFILAIVIFAVLFGAYGKQVVAPRIDSVVAGSAAEEVGLQPGDLILSMDGNTVESFSDIQRIVTVNAGVPMEVVIDRGGETLERTVTPKLRVVEDRFGNKNTVGMLGIQRSTKREDIIVQHYAPHKAIWLGIEETWDIVVRTGQYISGVIAGRQPADQLGGPIRVAQISGQVASLGIMPLIHMMAFLSVSIGLINLVPVPMLDGGHLLFYAIEAVRGRPLSDRALELSFRVGVAIVLSLMVLVTWNDIMHLASL
ncbi:MAG: RIP metalloprotease RseP [Hyphomicrobiales bacterium]|nr:MAG: RIP metalloprotease RseP [Hyphomicrobiales bacterium]